ncbi:sugar transferase, partial [Candidatus Saccharibacteria bacterium]|nr:sugar transferase [Candidatus Saccharibacteria bacterium]
LVGPRAYKPDEIEYQQEKHPETTYYIKWLLTVKPGLTGPWQVGGRSKIPFQERVKIDGRYAQRKSLLEDIKLILKTPLVVLGGRGAY